ncbi:MAG: tRNA (5-methylaminomethyl-2-thiouridine)(34)-methyltransferase MnmD [Cyclobacteriaceae bacterium]|nr:tRNA (5-methylaminomethyl-2-thiouridine)(34)-methyltransferase MnmD [Cyclobacteriaceae bacterium]
MPDIRVILTGDGSHSLLNAELDETYHSRHGAVQESQYVFIKQGLNYWLEQNKQQQLTILEVGLGTALNAWLTFRLPELAGRQISYFAIEKFPLTKAVWQQLNYAAHDRNLFEKIHALAWNSWQQVTPLAMLFKSESSLHQIVLPDLSFDIIYYDAFAPNKQPDMWTMDVLQKVVMKLQAGGVFVTYCAKGQLKRDLKALGLEVESLPGPPGKREMIRAVRLNS